MMTTHLRPATHTDYPEIISWVPDLESARFWGGPQMVYPLTVEFLVAQMKPTDETTFALVDSSDRLIGFGQLQFQAPHRFHLARLIVKPSERGKGNGRTLVTRLMAKALPIPGRFYTLNVSAENQRAQNLYLSLGFQFAPHPIGSIFSETSLFMRKDN